MKEKNEKYSSLKSKIKEMRIEIFLWLLLLYITDVVFTYLTYNRNIKDVSDDIDEILDDVDEIVDS